MIIINSLFLEIYFSFFFSFFIRSYLIFGSALYCFRCYLLLNLNETMEPVRSAWHALHISIHEWTILWEGSSKLQEITCLVCAQASTRSVVCVSSSALHVHFACLSQEPQHIHTHIYVGWAVFNSIMQFDALCHIW